MGEHFLDAYRYTLTLDNETIEKCKGKIAIPVITETNVPDLVNTKSVTIKLKPNEVKKMLFKLFCGYKGHDRLKQKMKARRMMKLATTLLLGSGNQCSQNAKLI